MSVTIREDVKNAIAVESKKDGFNVSRLTQKLYEDYLKSKGYKERVTVEVVGIEEGDNV